MQPAEEYLIKPYDISVLRELGFIIKLNDQEAPEFINRHFPNLNIRKLGIEMVNIFFTMHKGGLEKKNTAL